MTRNDELLTLTRRAVAHLEARTTDQAPGTMALPVSAYCDPDRYKAEIDRIFHHLPLALALSSELQGPGGYRAMTVMGRPILLVRGNDGVARAFLNVCRHRGAPVCAPGTGSKLRFSCPYHAWSYDNEGRLAAMYGDTTFGDVERASLSLTELPSAERAGFIWAALTPGASFDIDDWLGELAPQIAALELDQWHIFQRRELDGPGWKIAWDGYLEGYHQSALHPNTVGKNTIGNLMVVDAYGPHQRIVFARKSLRKLRGVPEAEWDPAEHIRLIHSTFPNLSISGVLGDHCLVSQLFPGTTPDRSVTVQTILCQTPPETEDARQAAEAFSAMVLQAVCDEDYAVGFQIQDGLSSGANKEFVFGRNEPTLQHYHRWVARLGGQG